ncbi:adenosylcobinamide amidohydrolase [Longispora albida]|uniref:adenosylcobinamide amidohydrolase n=1 Tax=Longispora albida TaxID=203523 RepID=UPI0004765FEE|nr:adenosylcobinamide amidohydrolase [Longispora albida]
MQAQLATGQEMPILYWNFRRPLLGISSGTLGGGLGERHWALNASVPMSYDRDDPGTHLAELGAALGLAGPGTGLMTGVDVRDAVTAEDGGVSVSATVGLGSPAWAAAPDGHLRRLRPRTGEDVQPGVPVLGNNVGDPGGAYRPGTVNLVGFLPVRLGDAALVNAVATVAEAKAQAMWELGIEATGTASDAVALFCPLDGPAEPYGGPRSAWGARLARAVHAAIMAAGKDWLANPRAWQP